MTKSLIARHCPVCGMVTRQDVQIINGRLVYQCRPCSRTEELPEEYQYAVWQKGRNVIRQRDRG
jgi:hypothetical protein